MQQQPGIVDSPLGTTHPPLDARGQRDIRAAAIFTYVLAGLTVLSNLNLLFGGGSLISALTGAIGILVVGPYLWVLIHVYQAISAVR